MTDCINSTYAIGTSGYCYVNLGGKPVGHHRLAYAKANGVALEDMQGKVVMHTCDNRTCINPEHLRLGTTADNNADMRAKGRASGNPNPVFNPMAKLTPEQVKEIRNNKQLTYDKLAKMFSVSKSTICRVKKQQVWSVVA